jgi:hypothetical protein
MQRDHQPGFHQFAAKWPRLIRNLNPLVRQASAQQILSGIRERDCRHSGSLRPRILPKLNWTRNADLLALVAVSATPRNWWSTIEHEKTADCAATPSVDRVECVTAMSLYVASDAGTMAGGTQIDRIGGAKRKGVTGLLDTDTVRAIGAPD